MCKILATSLGIFSQQALFNPNLLCVASKIYCTVTLNVCGGSGGCCAVFVLCIESNWAEGFYHIFYGNVNGFFHWCYIEPRYSTVPLILCLIVQKS